MSMRLMMRNYNNRFVRIRSFKDEPYYYKELFSLTSEKSRYELREFIRDPEHQVYITHAKALMPVIPDTAIEEEGGVYVWCPVTEDDLEKMFACCEIIPDAEPLSFEDEVQQAETRIIASYNQAVNAGIDIDLGLTDDADNSLGALHYSISGDILSAMSDRMLFIASGYPTVLWRDDSSDTYMNYTAEQFRQLYMAVKQHIYACEIERDKLITTLRSYTSADIHEVRTIHWSTGGVD